MFVWDAECAVSLLEKARTATHHPNTSLSLHQHNNDMTAVSMSFCGTFSFITFCSGTFRISHGQWSHTYKETCKVASWRGEGWGKEEGPPTAAGRSKARLRLGASRAPHPHPPSPYWQQWFSSSSRKFPSDWRQKQVMNLLTAEVWSFGKKSFLFYHNCR